MKFAGLVIALGAFLLCRFVVEGKERDFLLSRPSAYFGLQTKSKDPVYVGLLWHQYSEERNNFMNIREAATYQDYVAYKVLGADGINFGRVSLNDTLYGDNNLLLEYVKPRDSNDSAAWRISGSSNIDGVESTIALYTFVGVSGTGHATVDTGGEVRIRGECADYPASPEGGFRFRTVKTSGLHSSMSYYANVSSTPFSISNDILPILYGEPKLVLPNATSSGSNYAVMQMVFRTPFSWELHFESGNHPVAESFDFQVSIDSEKALFKDHHANIFVPEGESADHPYSEFSRQVLSHLLYGLSYFRGRRFYINDTTDERIEIPDAELLSLIPSKNGFPRPFFWDEGFHQEAVWRWDPSLFESIVESWFALQLSNGWIVREMIIGDEALSHAPEWAWAQRSSEMNPPILFFTIEEYVEDSIAKGKTRGVNFLARMFPLLQKTFSWYVEHTQPEMTGLYNHTFFWNGRFEDKSYDSGFDDFPRYDLRYFPPSDVERSVDMQSWMTRLGKTMARLAGWISDPSEAYFADSYALSLSQLNLYFWNDQKNFFTDVLLPNTMQSHVGVVGILPLCLSLLDAAADESRVSKMLNVIESELLDSSVGLLSLSPQDDKFNSIVSLVEGGSFEQDVLPEFVKGTYWRGASWGNMNWYCVRSMSAMGNLQARLIAEDVRLAYVGRVYEHYQTTYVSERGGLGRFRVEGTIHEVYHPFTGKPTCHWPFTGWTASSVLLMLQRGYPYVPPDSTSEGESKGLRFSSGSFGLGLLCGVALCFLLGTIFFCADRLAKKGFHSCRRKGSAEYSEILDEKKEDEDVSSPFPVDEDPPVEGSLEPDSSDALSEEIA